MNIVNHNAATLLRVMAVQLATTIDHELTGLTENQRCNLRGLTCDLRMIADTIDPEHAPEIPDRQNVVPLRRSEVVR